MRGTGTRFNPRAMKSESYIPGRNGGVDDEDNGDAMRESCRRFQDPRTWMTL